MGTLWEDFVNKTFQTQVNYRKGDRRGAETGNTALTVGELFECGPIKDFMEREAAGVEQ